MIHIRSNFQKTSRHNIESYLRRFDPIQRILLACKFSIGWFIERIFKTLDGLPLKLMNYQLCTLEMMWNKKFPMIIMSRGGGKSYLLAVYALLRAMLIPGSKIVIAGSGLRQAKIIFKYIEDLFNSSPILQKSLSAYGKPTYASDQVYLNVGTSRIIGIPIGDGDKIRGLRASVLIVDEMATVPEDIFETVLVPFGAVNMNPALSASVAQVTSRLERLGADKELLDLISQSQGFGNQIVIAGTASYKHNHLYKRYRLYKLIIESAGNRQSLTEALEAYSSETTGTTVNVQDKDIDSFCKNWHQYCIVQIPHDVIPAGALDADLIATQRAKLLPSVFAMEYEAQFPEDTDGFFRRSVVEAATPKSPNEIPVHYEIYGDPRYSYVLGLDPARHNDNFGAVILKLTDRGLELVHCQAWNKLDWGSCAIKIKEMCRRFNIVRIAMDKQGGGEAVADWLCKSTPSFNNSELIWPIPADIKDPTIMGAPGKKILELVNFSAGWTTETAYSLASAIQQRALLFPYKIDDIDMQNQYMRYYDKSSMEEEEKLFVRREIEGLDEFEAKETKQKSIPGVKGEIDECINELCSIVRTVNTGGTEKFDLPGIKQSNVGDARRRDRFSALLLASHAARMFRGNGIKVPVNIPKSSKAIVRNKSRYNITRRGSAIY